MNRSLLARTRPEFYADAVKNTRERGVPEEKIATWVLDSISAARALFEGKCPKCGAPSARYIDRENQQGASAMPGTWVMYRCSTAPPPGKPRGGACDFAIDYVEGDEAN